MKMRFYCCHCCLSKGKDPEHTRVEKSAKSFQLHSGPPSTHHTIFNRHYSLTLFTSFPAARPLHPYWRKEQQCHRKWHTDRWGPAQPLPLRGEFRESHVSLLVKLHNFGTLNDSTGTAVPHYPLGIGSRSPRDTKIQGCSRPLYKLA